MGTLLGLAFGVGVLLTVEAFRAPRLQNQARAKVLFADRTRLRNQVLSSIGCVLAGLVLTKLAIVGLIAGVVGLFIPGVLAARRGRLERAKRRSAWPDVIDSLVSAVRAGMSLPEAVCGVADRGPDCLRNEFAAFANDYRSSGRFEAALLRLRDRLADPVADRIVEALLAARDVGGTELGRMLRTLSDFLRQDLRLRGEAEARRSWTVNGARLAVAAPWFVLMLLSTRPGTVDAYRTTAGMFVLIVSAALTAVAYLLMTKIGRLPEERRMGT